MRAAENPVEASEGFRSSSDRVNRSYLSRAGVVGSRCADRPHDLYHHVSPLPDSRSPGSCRETGVYCGFHHQPSGRELTPPPSLFAQSLHKYRLEGGPLPNRMRYADKSPGLGRGICYLKSSKWKAAIRQTYVAVSEGDRWEWGLTWILWPGAQCEMRGGSSTSRLCRFARNYTLGGQVDPRKVCQRRFDRAWRHS
jgi:hypothetical protein